MKPTGLKMGVSWETRLCKVGEETGYFHIWEPFSEPSVANLAVGNPLPGIFSKVYGIVEFPDGVRRVDPTDIHFCDEEHATLELFNKKGENV